MQEERPIGVVVSFGRKDLARCEDSHDHAISRSRFCIDEFGRYKRLLVFARITSVAHAGGSRARVLAGHRPDLQCAYDCAVTFDLAGNNDGVLGSSPMSSEQRRTYFTEWALAISATCDDAQRH